MTSHSVRQMLDLSQNDLAIAFDIPVATVRNWDSKDTMPIYIYEMLAYIAFYDEHAQKNLKERIARRKAKAHDHFSS